jgi:uncharacterized damage-inducible protein DinB
MLNNPHRAGAVGILLDVYEKAFFELKEAIDTIPDGDLETIVDATTNDPNCRSIQSVLSHIVSAAYSYVIYIRAQRGEELARPDKKFHQTIKEYTDDFSAAFHFMADAISNMKDEDLCNQSNKMHVAWGQDYDTEQMIEHAIVHVMRHTHQIERFKLTISKARERIANNRG